MDTYEFNVAWQYTDDYEYTHIIYGRNIEEAFKKYCYAYCGDKDCRYDKRCEDCEFVYIERADNVFDKYGREENIPMEAYMKAGWNMLCSECGYNSSDYEVVKNEIVCMECK